MEQYRYSEAASEFDTAVSLMPDWLPARFNLGVAYFNMYGQAGAQQNLAKARGAYEAVLAAAPDHLYARYCLGLYHQHVGEDESALACFQAVQEQDPGDPYVAYKCAEALLSLERGAEGTKMLERVVGLDPGFISAVYRLALQYQRAGRRQEALPLFERFRGLKDRELAGGTFAVQKTYGQAGKYYQVLGAEGVPHAREHVPTPFRILFSPETLPLPTQAVAWRGAGVSVGLPGIAAGDIDGDGDLDLCLTGMGDGGAVAFWLNDGTGRFVQGQSIARGGVSPCLGDVDNDGDLDLWLGRAGQDLLLANDGKGLFAVDPRANTGGPDQFTSCARLLDLDSDGDLDMLACRLGSGSIPVGAGATPASSSLYNNNRDGSFSDIADRLGLVDSRSAVAALAYDDLDDDRDLDIVLFPAEGSAVVWVNDRVGAFRLLGADATGLDVRDVLSATTGDPDKDGDRDLLVFTGAGPRLYVNGGQLRFGAGADFARRFGHLGGTAGQFADMDNDGDQDLVIPDARRHDGSRGPVLLLNDWPRGSFLDAAALDPSILLAAIRTKGAASCVVADFTGDGRCDIVLAEMGERPMLVQNLTQGGHWVEFDVRGTRTRDQRSRSNGSAVGARVGIKAGSVAQQFTVGVSTGGVTMPPLRVHAGLGGQTKVDWLRILWPDGVLQAELELPGDCVAPIVEMPRKTSSCPCLFVWNGTRFEFICDFGGVGGLGYFLEPGSYAPPDPTEYLPLPRLEPLNGDYVVQVLEPLEEVAYIDEVKLLAVDHPQGTAVVPREMMAVGVPPPPFELFCYRTAIAPERAVDHRGTVVTDELLRVDRRYAGATALDARFIGIAEEHWVELDFGDRLGSLDADGRLVLILHGWVEYGYSSTNYAASQAGARVKAPSIYAWREDRWVELFREVGYPAGLNHLMALDVTGKILPTDRRIRIASNMELYWDRIAVAQVLGSDGLATQEVAARTADLHFLGYPREYSPDGHHPNLYDYENVDRAVAWKLMAGQYTRFGEVRELLDDPDDRYVIMGRGEELTLRFRSADFRPVPPGYTRTFLLKTDSYCKDMDLYTAFSDTVEPLPFHGMTGYPYPARETYPDSEKTRTYRRTFNTRHVRPR